MANRKAKLSNFPKIDRRYVWMGLGLLTLVINAIFRSNPYFTEVVYSRGIFLLIRWIWDYSLGLIPLPLVYVIGPLLILYLIRSWRKGKPHRLKRPVKNRIASLFISLLGLAGAAVFFFYFLWGFNYNRLPVAQQLKLELSELTDEEVEAEYERCTALMIEAHEAFLQQNNDFYYTASLAKKPEWKKYLKQTEDGRDYIDFSDEEIEEEYHSLIMEGFFEQISDSLFKTYFNLEELEDQIIKDLKSQLQAYNYPVPGNPKAIYLKPKGLLMQLGARGVYIPYTAQGHVDAGLNYVSVPSVMAHELAHAYGFGHEGICNFWAYMTCSQSEVPLIRYSGYINYWRHVAALFNSRNPEAYKQAYKKLPKDIIFDLNAMRAASRKYPGFFPRFSQAFYERYLKWQGIEEGRKSYSLVVSYVVAQSRKSE